MTVQDENGVYRSLARERRNQRRKQLGVGLAGLLAIAGAGAFAAQIDVVDLLPSSDRPLVIAQPQRTPSASPSPAASAPVSVVRSKKTVTPWRVVRSGVRQRTSPTPPPPPSPSVLIASAPVVQLNENTASGTIRVTVAAFDLSGRPELALVGDQGWAVGRARCSRSARSDAGAAASAAPPTLVCWRTSPQRSVVTVATSSRGRPATAESIAVLEREWARLG
ncbi:hypothetical protein [Actinoplanes solisilvae]|uniref:hypothetical protein n=1 Tax=Actinoplanes solisilvae TaxID=2486853 RepID=UPI000FD8EA25|nr:hypothetical protein [Actinoplanes solisilvae]